MLCSTSIVFHDWNKKCENFRRLYVHTHSRMMLDKKPKSGGGGVSLGCHPNRIPVVVFEGGGGKLSRKFQTYCLHIPTTEPSFFVSCMNGMACLVCGVVVVAAMLLLL